MGGVSGVVAAESQPISADRSATTGGIEIYEHRTDSGAEIHTIVLPPEEVSETGVADDVVGIVVVPERGRVCQAVAGESYEAANAGRMRDESTVDAYLGDTAVERLSDGEYRVE